MIYSTNNLSKVYGTKVVLRKVNLNIEKGEFLLLAGHNGAGKSTLISLLANRLKPTKGEILYNEKPLKSWGNDYYNHVGFLGDATNLYPQLTVYRNLTLVAKIYGLPQSRVDDVLEEFSLEVHKGKKLTELSKGLKQRVNFARAIMHNPKIIMADEPFSGIDITFTKTMVDMLEGWKNMGRTIILATHTFDHIWHLPHRVAIIKDASLVYHDNTENISPEGIVEHY